MPVRLTSAAQESPSGKSQIAAVLTNGATVPKGVPVRAATSMLRRAGGGVGSRKAHRTEYTTADLDLDPCHPSRKPEPLKHHSGRTAAGSGV
ncbi:S-type pyocin domain-containing protein [Pseudomonas aeruginosa]|nr:S-type pyocin domain-containing protein [Pseudomonas aeruginosa]